MTDMGQCDPEIIKNGTCAVILGGGSARIIEAIIVQVREDTGLRIDWHYVGGRAVVLTLDDVDKVADAVISRSHIMNLRP